MPMLQSEVVKQEQNSSGLTHVLQRAVTSHINHALVILSITSGRLPVTALTITPTCNGKLLRKLKQKTDGKL